MPEMLKTDIKQGGWVAQFDHERDRRPRIGFVQDAYKDPIGPNVLLDIVLYDKDGTKIGRESPHCGGPRKFEPACASELWEPIERPDFDWLAQHFFYGDHIKRRRAVAH